MWDLRDLPTDLRPVGQGVRLADAAEAQGAQRPPLLRLRPDGRPRLRHPQLRHAYLTSVYSTGPRWVSLYASSRPLGTNSSADRPRRRATWSGRFSALSPAIVARATLM